MYTLSQTEIDDIKQGRMILLDVRSSEELAEKSCQYAKHFDVQQMMKGYMPKLDKQTPIAVYCRFGNRSALAQQLLIQNGFLVVHNIGGIHDVPQELCEAVKV
jgi:phage shock protein E